MQSKIAFCSYCLQDSAPLTSVLQAVAGVFFAGCSGVAFWQAAWGRGSGDGFFVRKKLEGLGGSQTRHEMSPSAAYLLAAVLLALVAMNAFTFRPPGSGEEKPDSKKSQGTKDSKGSGE